MKRGGKYVRRKIRFFHCLVEEINLGGGGGGNENGVGNFSPGLTNFNPWREMWDENVKKKNAFIKLLFCPLKPNGPIFFFLKRKLGNIVNLKKLYFSSTLSCVKMWTFSYFMFGKIDILVLIVDINIK